MSVNRVIILGRLGQDPEVKMTQGGQQVCTLSVATSESWTKDGKKEDRTEWHRIVLWGKLAEVAGKYLKKGVQAYFEGKIQTRSWDDQSGQKRYATEIIATDLRFVEKAQNNSGNQQHQNQPPAQQNHYQQQNQYSDYGPSDSDVPF